MAEHDLNQLAAARAEQRLETTTFKFGDPVETFTAPNFLDWPGEATHRLASGDLTGALTEILGPEQFERFWALRPTNGDLYALMGLIEQDQGLEGLGESPPSNRASRRTSARSKRTSSGTTVSTLPPASRRGPSAKRPGGSAT